MLTGKKIAEEVAAGRILIEPFNHVQCKSNSYDYRLDPLLRILQCNSMFDGVSCLDMRLPQKYVEVEIPEKGYLLMPGVCYIGRTMEKFSSDHYPSSVTGKSSIGRLFLTNHYCADHIDQGYSGRITLEITAEMPTLVFPGMPFGQIRFFESVGECELYSGRYQGSEGAVPSRIHLDFEK